MPGMSAMPPDPWSMPGMLDPSSMPGMLDPSSMPGMSAIPPDP
jgi:hypothetical protein